MAGWASLIPYALNYIQGGGQKKESNLVRGLRFDKGKDWWKDSLTGFGILGGGGDGEEETVKLEPMKEKWQLDLGQKLSDFAKQYMGGYQPGKPYSMTAWQGPTDYSRLSQMMTPSPQEQQGLDYLGGDYMKKPTSKVLGEAKDVISKTLTGGYDPYTSPKYESLRRNLELEKKKEIKKLNQMIGSAGLGGSSFRAGGLVDITQGTFDKVSDVLADLDYKERLNSMNMVPTAMELAKLEENIPEQRLSQLFKYGALPRELEGVGYKDFLRQEEEKKALENFLYSDFIRKQGEFGGVADLGRNLFEYNIPYGSKSLDYSLPTSPSNISGLEGLTSGISGIMDMLKNKDSGMLNSNTLSSLVSEVLNKKSGISNIKLELPQSYQGMYLQ